MNRYEINTRPDLAGQHSIVLNIMKTLLESTSKECFKLDTTLYFMTEEQQFLISMDVTVSSLTSYIMAV